MASCGAKKNCLEWYVQDPIQRKGLASSSQIGPIIKIPREPTEHTDSLSDPPEPGQIHLTGSRNVQVPNSTQVMLRSVDWI